MNRDELKTELVILLHDFLTTFLAQQSTVIQTADILIDKLEKWNVLDKDVWEWNIPND